MLSADLHTHTRYSHGKGTPEQNVLAAIERGLEAVAISEHAPGHGFYGVSPGRLVELRQEVDDLAAKYRDRIQVLMGIECNLTGFGRCDMPDEDFFDIKLLAFHKGAVPRDGFGLARCMESLGLGKSDPVKTAEALLCAAEQYRIDIFAHPGLYVKCDIPTLARGAAELGIKLEINAARVTMTDEELQQAVYAGAKLIICSDAHQPERVGDDHKALAAAERAGVLHSVTNLKHID